MKGLLIGSIIGGVIGAICVAVTRKKVYVTVNQQEETPKEKMSERIKKAAEDKVDKILEFYILHKEKVDAVFSIASTVVGLVTLYFDLFKYGKKFKKQEKDILELRDKVARLQLINNIEVGTF